MSLPDLRVVFRTEKLEGSNVDKNELVFAYLVRVCDVLNIDGRDPDEWEVMQVLAALGALRADFSRLAATYVDLAMTPPAERTENWREPESRVTRQQLEHAIQSERHRSTAS